MKALYLAKTNDWSNKVYVIASSYDEAEQKALDYLKHKKSVENILDGDGSLRINSDKIEIKEIELCTRELIE